MAKSKINPSYLKALMGVSLIVIIIMVINNFSKKADIEDYSKYKAKIDVNKQFSPFSEPQKDSVSIVFAGFWQNEIPLKDASTPGVRDRIEIKKNGIIWRVITYTYLTPANDTARFIHAMTAYLRPFASNKTNSSHVKFDTRVIRQAFAGKDTCYGTGDYDTTFEIIRTPEGLITGGKNYSSFDTSDIKHFFPEGAVAMVDAITVNACNNDYLTKDFRDLALILPHTSSLQSQKEAK